MSWGLPGGIYGIGMVMGVAWWDIWYRYGTVYIPYTYHTYTIYIKLDITIYVIRIYSSLHHQATPMTAPVLCSMCYVRSTCISRVIQI